MDDKNPMIDKMQKDTTELFVSKCNFPMTEDIYPYRFTKETSKRCNDFRLANIAKLFRSVGQSITQRPDDFLLHCCA